MESTSQRTGSMVKIFNYLPQIYQSFLPDFFQNEIPEETLATCQNCAMCSENDDISTATSLFFTQTTKCCTYYPTIPNYLAGGILSDKQGNSEEGKRILNQIIDQKAGVFPHKILPPTNYQILYKSTREYAFGRAQSLLCPFFNKETGSCFIWKFRSRMCSTWFCKTEKGKDGNDFWDATGEFLAAIEKNISMYILRELGFEAQHVIALVSKMRQNVQEIDGHVTSDVFEDRWRHWHGNEKALYIKAYKAAKKLNNTSFENIMGIQGVLHVERLQQLRNNMLSPVLPSRLKRNPELTICRVKDKVQLESDVCKIAMNQRTYTLLDYFDGNRSTAEINEITRSQHACVIGEKLLVKLYQNKILV